MVTVIVAVLNGAQTLERCLKSAENQSCCNWELIVIDGGSSDGSVEMIKAHKDRISYWESSPDRGVYHAWNKALTHARGEWICFLGADDRFWDRHVLADLLPFLKQAAEAGIRVVYGRVARVTSDGRVVAVWGKPWAKIRWQMPHGMPLGMPHSGLMHHCTLFQDHGLFDETFRIAGDYEFLLRELKNKNNRALLAEGVISVGQQIGGLADANSLYFHREVLRAREKNGLSRISWLWLAVHGRNLLRDGWRRLSSGRK